MHDEDDIAIDAIRSAARRRDVVDAVGALYRELDAEITSLSPTCWNKGECCRFGEYGHRLYVTTLEAAYYLAVRPPERESAGPRAAAREANPPSPVTSLPVLEPRLSSTKDVCPHAHGGRCHVRPVRPIGCRIFYCDPAAAHWQGPMTEKYLARLREMHEALDVAYVYADWIKVLEGLERSGNV